MAQTFNLQMIKCHCEMIQYMKQALELLSKKYDIIDSISHAINSSTDNICLIACEHQLPSQNNLGDKSHLYCIHLTDNVKSSVSTANQVSIRHHFTASEFTSLLQKCKSYFQYHHENDDLVNELVGESSAIKHIRTMIRQVASCDSNILILGESGTGKEVVASCIHHYSKRKNMPFVPINCGAIPSELMESELFGHEKGAFTGAASKRVGRFEISNNGTIFLDEIGDMPLSMQVKLLRVLQERKIERVGSTTSHDIDVRVIAATNKNLEEMIRHNLFREDLFYRLNVIPIIVPSLHQRLDDIPLLADSLIHKLNKRIHTNSEFTSDAIQALKLHTWPGNIRELANFLERMVVLYSDRVITHIEIGEELTRHKPTQTTQPLLFNINDFEKFNLKEYLTNVEHQVIQQALEKANGIVSYAAEYLNLRRTTLVEKMKKYNLVTAD